jgi:acyl-CoA thioester hydrolase
VIPDKSPIYTFTHELRSRYSETDKMGYVYYGRYLEYFEVARTEMIRSLGFPYQKLEEQGILLPVVESHVDYKAPLYYDDLIKIDVMVYDVPMVKLETYYKMYTQRGEGLHATGKVSLCFMNEENRKPCRAPQVFLDCLSEKVEN